MHQYDFDYDAQEAQVTRTSKEITALQAVTNTFTKAFDDMKKAPLRRKALNAIADNALATVNAQIEADKQAKFDAKKAANLEKKVAKEATAKSKLEKVVENTETAGAEPVTA